MRWLKAFGWLPVPVFYRDTLSVPKFSADGVFPWLHFGWMSVGGFSWLLAICIRSKYINDEGIHQHELDHAEQGWQTLLIPHALLYLFYAPYRQWAEVQAYRRQIACYGPGANIDFAVKALTTMYRLKLSEFEARRLLTV